VSANASEENSQNKQQQPEVNELDKTNRQESVMSNQLVTSVGSISKLLLQVALIFRAVSIVAIAEIELIE